MSALPESFKDFAYCPDLKFTDLEKLSAQDEYWGNDNWILASYLRNTYARAAQLWNRDAENEATASDGLVVTGDRAIFNTGLFTDAFEPIYLLFEPNWKKDAIQKWCLRGTYKASDRALGSFSMLPERVYFDEDPRDLVFDHRLQIRPNYDHILRDEENVKRLPPSLCGEGSYYLLRHAFEGAVEEARRRASANYTLAVPQYYNGKVQLLLPLRLTSNKAELALTIERVSGHYAARTCLDMEMAYCNARVICKPEASWIRPMEK